MNFSLELWLGDCGLGVSAWELWTGNFSLGLLAWELWFRNFGLNFDLGTLAWKLWLRNVGLETLAQECWLGNFGLVTLAWKLWLQGTAGWLTAEMDHLLYAKLCFLETWSFQFGYPGDHFSDPGIHRDTQQAS